jgi:Icc-related predicted phosphoesterase
MKITLVSDLHLEFSDIDIKNESGVDVLILAGDIMIAQDMHDHPEPANAIEQSMMAGGQGLGRRQESAQRFRDFLKRCSFQFPHVIYIAGNHEFYHGKFVASLQHLRDECSKFPNIYFLERDTKVIDDVVFVGGTLWTNMNKGDPLTLHAVGDMMNDFRIVRHDGHGYTKLRPAHAALRHRETLDYIRVVLDENRDRRCVVVSHMAPSFQSISERYAGESLMNGAYASDLSEFILDRPQIKLWVHGHVHSVNDYMIGDTRVVSNPRGYQAPGYVEDTGWDPNLVLEV